jgi:hypothetical protein
MYTYRDLLNILQNCTDIDLDSTLTIYSDFEGEYYPAYLRECDDDGVLDTGHPVITRLGY